MNGDLRDLLADLATYLEQQRRTGGEFYFEVPPGEVSAAPDGEQPVQREIEAPSAPEPATEPAAAPDPPAAPRPAPTFRIDDDDPFAQECAVFVQDALALIARSRGLRPAAPRPQQTQTGLFESGARTEADPEPMPAEPEDPADALEALGAEVRACTACGLHAGRQNAVPGAGNARATLMLIGEAPGQAEDQQGLPFVGPSGKLLTDILKAIGFARDDVFIGNVLKCRPPGNRDPERAEVQACEPYLRRQIRIIQPRVILCLGRIAAQTLLGTTASLRSLRETVHFFAGVPVMATYHPAALLRNPASKRDTWDDVRKLRVLHDALASSDGSAASSAGDAS
jgi:DNA polymerase